MRPELFEHWCTFFLFVQHALNLRLANAVNSPDRSEFGGRELRGLDRDMQGKPPVLRRNAVYLVKEGHCAAGYLPCVRRAMAQTATRCTLRVSFGATGCNFQRRGNPSRCGAEPQATLICRYCNLAYFRGTLRQTGQHKNVGQGRRR